MSTKSACHSSLIALTIRRGIEDGESHSVIDITELLLESAMGFSSLLYCRKPL